MVGMETLTIDPASVGHGTPWAILTRNVLNDLGLAMPQAGGTMPTWPAGTPILQLSSKIGPDTGDDGSFAESDMSDKSPYWRATNPVLTALQCVQGRHDRVMKAKNGFSTDEYCYDILNYCQTNFSNPTVPIYISDNGWAYGEHNDAHGKMEPYDLASVGPLFWYWPDSSSATHYPYFPVRPNILIMVVDDDDSLSLNAGYPILNSNTFRDESNLIAWNGDIAPTVCDLAGAPMYRQCHGVSLAPYMSGGLTGQSPRSYAWFNVQQHYENGEPTIHGIGTLTQRYWTVAPITFNNPMTTGQTAAPAGVTTGTYAGITEGYDVTPVTGDPDQLNNYIANPSVNPGYTPPKTFSASALATLQAQHAAAQADVPTLPVVT